MRILYTVMLCLHVLGIIVWVGGMFLMHFAVRPAAARLLAPPQRLPLLAAVLDGFFRWVTIAVLLVLASGAAMIVGGGGFVNAHVSVHVMLALGVVMTAIYGYVRWIPFRSLQAAVSGSDWPSAALALDHVRRLVSVNLTLGVLTTIVATIGRAVL
jgi:uncharacterized membrane protein